MACPMPTILIESITVPATRARALRDAHVSDLATSIAEVGLLNPITLTGDGTLIAGRHRLAACIALGWTEIAATILDGDAIRIEKAELHENLKILPLTQIERADHVSRLAALWEAEHPGHEHGATEGKARGSDGSFIQSAHREHSGDPTDVRASTALAAETGLSEQTARRLRRIGDNVSDEAKAAVEDTPIADSLKALDALATIDPAEQVEVVARGEKAILEKAKEIRAAKREKNRAEREKVAKVRPPAPVGLYRCIVIDPPWEMEKIERDERPNQTGFDYPAMTMDELRALVLPAAGAAHLYLWTTHKHLPDALALAEAWGFTYQCLLTWVKNVGMTPFTWMYSTELCLYCHRGGLRVEKMGLRLDFAAKVREHSRKPDEFYALIEQASPGPRIDMFGRQAREGWDVWGNQTAHFEETP
jgi:N6-adenosine-specific RNA methylase IME4